MKILTLQDINKEIKGCGFNYSLKDFSKQLGIIYLSMVGVSVFFQIKIGFIIALCLAMLLIIPYIYRAQFKFLYEQTRFDDATLYMTQMISNFKKYGKIRKALAETRDIVPDAIAEFVDEAIDYIDEGQFENNLYKEALEIIEEQYGCSRMSSLHEFLVRIETNGGEYATSINILLDDLEAWTDRTYVYQRDNKMLRTHLLIAIVLSGIISGAISVAIPEKFDITSAMSFQIVTTIAIFLMFLFYAAIQCKLVGHWLDDKEGYSEKFIDKKLDIFHNYNEKLATTKALPIVLILAALGVYFCIQGSYTTGIACVIGSLYFFTSGSRKKKYAKKVLDKEILKAFPDWLRDLSLSLQTKTVRVAIQTSYDDAPYILKDAIKQITEEFKENPTDIEPYINFLKEYNLREVNQAMRMLYSLNSASRDDTNHQLNELIRKNAKMLEKSEKIKNENTTAIKGIMIFVPMLIASAKMIVDMILMLVNSMNLMQF